MEEKNPSTDGKILEKTKDWVERSKLSTDSEGYANSHPRVPSVVILLFKKPVKRHKIEKKYGVMTTTKTIFL